MQFYCNIKSPTAYSQSCTQEGGGPGYGVLAQTEGALKITKSETEIKIVMLIAKPQAKVGFLYT
jgi:hypothetical protein